MKTAEERAVAVFDLLGDPTRYRVLGLCDGTRTVSEIAAVAGVTVGAVSQHLRRLSDKDVIAASREGRQVRYQRVPGALDDARAVLARLAEGG